MPILLSLPQLSHSNDAYSKPNFPPPLSTPSQSPSFVTPFSAKPLQRVGTQDSTPLPPPPSPKPLPSPYLCPPPPLLSSAQLSHSSALVLKARMLVKVYGLLWADQDQGYTTPTCTPHLYPHLYTTTVKAPPPLNTSPPDNLSS